MNHIQFIESLEGYYYKYDTQFVKNTMFNYITRIDQAELPYILDKIKLTYSRKWKVTPDINIIDQVIKDINDYRYHKPSLGPKTLIKFNNPDKLKQNIIKQIEEKS